MNVLLGLFWGSFVSRTCIYILLGLFSTTLLPTGPLLWPWFNRLGIFKLWREYHRRALLQGQGLQWAGAIGQGLGLLQWAGDGAAAGAEMRYTTGDH